MSIKLLSEDSYLLQIANEEELCEEEYIVPFNYHNITMDDMNNGSGLRTVLWISGCLNACKECHNPTTWDACSGLPFDFEAKTELLDNLSKPWISGITFSGGDPFHPANREGVALLIKEIKEIYPEKNIWIYTGSTMKFDEQGEICFRDQRGNEFQFAELKNVDFIIDGPFEIETRKADLLADRKVRWRGSSNQRYINVRKTLIEKKIVVEE